MRPTLIISLDQELIWGSFDHTTPRSFLAAHPDPRGTVRALLELFDEFEIPTTWAIVGHLFLDSCSRGRDGRAHPEIVRPDYAWYRQDWLAADPCTDRARDPLWYGDDILELVQRSRIHHEIACHTFSHLVFGDPGCFREAAAADLRACIDLAAKRGIALKSFVFPRNVEGHHALLREFGFIAFRGEEPAWWRDLPGAVKRAGHLFDQATARRPPSVKPTEKLPGLWNLPGSLLLLHRHGVRRFIPFAVRRRRIELGLARAIETRSLFHLWFHPHNLSYDRRGLLAVLRSALRDAARLRDRGVLDIRTMGDLAEELCASRVASRANDAQLAASFNPQGAA
jgi:peptidoglycan/xylan/chitin deacetylase (PgdA/CDA1 family)